ncbi:MAG: hypothetical protein R2837_06350 [Aliarcobacter sp.]
MNYSDSHTDMMLDFSVNYNRRVDFQGISMFIINNAYKQKDEGNSGKNIQAINMLSRALDSGIYADYLLVDSWYTKTKL